MIIFAKFFQKNSCTVPLFQGPLAKSQEKRTKYEQTNKIRTKSKIAFNPVFLAVKWYHKLWYLIIQDDTKNLVPGALKQFLFLALFLNHVIQYHNLSYMSHTEHFNI